MNPRTSRAPAVLGELPHTNITRQLNEETSPSRRYREQTPTPIQNCAGLYRSQSLKHSVEPNSGQSHTSEAQDSVHSEPDQEASLLECTSEKNPEPELLQSGEGSKDIGKPAELQSTSVSQASDSDEVTYTLQWPIVPLEGLGAPSDPNLPDHASIAHTVVGPFGRAIPVKPFYAAEPIDIRIPISLLPLPAILKDDSTNLLYFHHFFNHTAQSLGAHYCSANPFQTILPRSKAPANNMIYDY